MNGVYDNTVGNTNQYKSQGFRWDYDVGYDAGQNAITKKIVAKA